MVRLKQQHIFMTGRQFLCHPLKALDVAEHEREQIEGMHLVQHLRGTACLKKKPTDMNLLPPKEIACPVPCSDRCGEAVTQADETLYGLRTKALIITLQT